MLDYEELWAAQGGVCAICLGVRKVLEVDHDHKLEKELIAGGWAVLDAARASVRGLCCRRCNGRLLTSCLDDTLILERAIAYLMSPPAPKVLLYDS